MLITVTAYHYLKNYLWFLLLLLPVTIIGQSTNATITGTVKDIAGKEISFASVSLFIENDSVPVKNTTCNQAGKFEVFNVKAGKYFLIGTAVGYKNGSEIKVAVIASKIYEQNIILSVEGKTLEDVKVVSKKPPIQIKADRTIMNVGASITAQGYNVFELLAKAPGVRIVNDEDILLNGKRGLAVYLDGKLLQIQGREIIDFLQTLPAANIEQIELITHPSARYDAAGSAGIINIRTKKSLNVGLNGSAMINGIVSDYKPKGTGSVNLNYRKAQYNLYGNYSYANGSYRNQLEDSRTQDLSVSGATNFSQHYRGVFPRKIHTYRIGADYFISKNSTLGFTVNGGYTTWLYDRNSITDIYKTTLKIDSQLLSKTVQSKRYNTQSYNLNYLYHDSLGRELNIDASYGRYKTSANTNQSNSYVNSLILLRRNANTSTNDADIFIAAAKADYSQKLWAGNLTAGMKVSKVESDNNLLFFNVINSTAIPDTGRTNHFLYTEKIAAGYFDYSFTYKKFDFQTGLRLEYTNSKGDLTTILSNTKKAVDTSYLNLFPNLVINYKANSNNNVGIAIGRRINRPAYQTLNPFEFVLDELTFTKGNPFLKPQTAFDIKLTHAYKSIFTSFISYTNIQNFILNYRDTLVSGKTFQSSINAGKEEYLVATATLQFSPQSWCDLMITGEVYKQWVNGRAGRTTLRMQYLTWDVSGSSTIRFGKKWSSEISGYYNSSYLDAPAISLPQFSIDAGLQRKILKDVGTLQLTVTDIFWSIRYRYDRSFGGLRYVSNNRNDSRQCRLSFNYRFGKKNVKASRKQNSSAAEEQKRITQ